LSPIYWLLAHRFPVPGLKLRIDYARLAFRLLYGRQPYISFAEIYRLLFWPIDSFRYFEFNFVWDALSNLSIHRYLDISSPRLFPVMLMVKKPELVADLVNPDTVDLTCTARLAKALGLEKRYELHGCLINAATFEPGSFDVVTSISVVEHIPQDDQAIRKMWEFVKPGGRLFLTVPCASESFEEFMDRNEYGLLEPNGDGFFFFQRYYDQRLLWRNIFCITGEPYRLAVYGEKSAGAYHRNAQSKLSDPNYPWWREPYLMGKEYHHFDSVDDLPGVGVIAMEFVKP
jgi:SAM-dependent methyltransferase